MKDLVILRVVAKIFIPFILIFALYVQFHGDFGPGGGFQAGVLFSVGFVLYALLLGPQAARRIMTPVLCRILAASGLCLYVGTGLVAWLMGGQFLDYNALAHHAHEGQHLGISLVELGVGTTVFSVITSIYLAFAERALP